MTKRDFRYLSADGETQIHAIEWIPEGKPAAVLQILHGMVEYVDRYDAFASFLAEKGYYVVGNDHLGHGESVKTDEDHGYFGTPDGNQYVVSDIHELRMMAQKKYPDAPYFMLGHSMGSFLLRQYLTVHGEGLSGAVVMGTGKQPAIVLGAGKLLCRLIALFKGWRHRSRLLFNMALGSYNKKFEPARTPNDWLSKNEESVDAYCADPWCTFRFTLNAYFFMFKGIGIAQKDAGKVPKDVPMLIVSGAEDPVGGSGKGVTEVYESYKKLGIRDIALKLYPGDRHEILNELDRVTVYADLYAWLEERRKKEKSGEKAGG